VSQAQPLETVQAWYELARAEGVPEPEAAALATATPDGRPSVRMVLIRGIDEHGVRFYTNRESRKGRELAANPYAAIAIHWHAMARQIRLEGAVEEVSDAESDAYFESRPYGSRLSAWASHQSTVLPDYETLERRVVEFGARYPETVPRPPHWGGYLLRPDVIELWQGRPNRLHDRVRHRRDGDAWIAERLAP
jgi:pyridoxamine 5'-phosphate oxidase